MEEYAWVAGFFDGEGSIGRYDNGRGSKHVMIQVMQKEPELLHKIKTLMGFGSVTGPYYKGTHPIYRYAVRNKAGCTEFAKRIWPWLGEIKRQQFIRAGILLEVGG